MRVNLGVVTLTLQLKPKWKKIMLRAWSVRFMALSALLSAIGTTLTMAQPYLGTDPIFLAGIVGALNLAAALIALASRFIKQKGVD